MLYEMQSDDGARHQTTRCLCRAVRQFFDQMTTLSLEGWLRVLRYVNRMLSDRRCIGLWAKPLAARHGQMLCRPKGCSGRNEAVSLRGLCSQPKRPAHEHLA